MCLLIQITIKMRNTYSEVSSTNCEVPIEKVKSIFFQSLKQYRIELNHLVLSMIGITRKYDPKSLILEFI